MCIRDSVAEHAGGQYVRLVPGAREPAREPQHLRLHSALGAQVVRADEPDPHGRTCEGSGKKGTKTCQSTGSRATSAAKKSTRSCDMARRPSTPVRLSL